MMPQGSNYPNQYDTSANLFSAQDSLTVVLQRDYNPGDDTVWVDGDISAFPPDGIITLTENHSEDKIVALYYHNKGQGTFGGLEATNETSLSFKPRFLTKVSQQIRAEYHNAILDSIIAVEKFLGTKKDTGNSLTGRLNNLTRNLYKPKAWFEVSKNKGVVPFTVQFTSRSSGAKEFDTVYEWDFGDGSKMSSNGQTIEKTYYKPNHYTVSLRVKNSYGEDFVVIKNIIEARCQAPNEAKIKFIPQDNQLSYEGKIRTPVGQFVHIEANDPGEQKDLHGKVVDPIIAYTWETGDNLPHGNSSQTKAMYGVGGIHNLILRTDTLLGAYRITNIPACIDVVEPQNLWLWMRNGNKIRAYEFGTTSETFKARNAPSQSINCDDSFLKSKRAKQVFNRNNSFGKIGKFSCMLFWASGQSMQGEEEIKTLEFNGFTDSYSSKKSIKRGWNWASLTSPSTVYFILGTGPRTPPSMSPTNQTRTKFSLTMFNSYEDMIGTYVNGAQELMFNPVHYDKKGSPLDGHFSIYRTAWKDQTGFILRNSDPDLQLRSFYKTEGVISEPFINIVKMQAMPGVPRREGQLAALSSGIFFFSNSETINAFNDMTDSWEVKMSGTGLRNLQDVKAVDFDKESNTLLAASDGNRKAYISFDYSEKAFMRFNEADLTFSALGKRPVGEQWLMGVF